MLKHEKTLSPRCSLCASELYVADSNRDYVISDKKYASGPCLGGGLRVQTPLEIITRNFF